MQHLRVPLGDHRARLGMEKSVPDVPAIYAGFIDGRLHPQDIPGVINLFLRFKTNPYLARAITRWIEADRLMQQMIGEGEIIHKLVLEGRHKHRDELSAAVARIDDLDAKLTVAEDDFSFALGAA